MQAIAHIAVLELHTTPMLVEQPLQVVLHTSSRQIVEDHHFVARRKQPVGDVCANESGPARD
jgi:hypothetical protein